jgi:hypothetical protein
LDQKGVLERVQKAGGANYDKEQNVSSKMTGNLSSFGNYKKSSKDFFKSLEKGGNQQINTSQKAFQKEFEAIKQSQI